MQQIAIYDLDRTLLRAPTFTPFLIFAARSIAPWRLALLPIWILAMAGYRAGLYSRKTLKQFGLWLLAGGTLPNHIFAPLIAEFARQRIARDYGAAARQSIVMHRDRGARIVIATAAPEIYAGEIGRQLGITDVIATRHKSASRPPGYLAKIDGENCYGAEKLRRVENWLSAQGLARADCDIISYSDHPSDAPLLNWSDRAVLVARSTRQAALAARNDWSVTDFG
jgi:phosphatidylglycerophosphatase C